MKQDRWGLIEEIFHGALACTPSERQGYVENAVGQDSELQQEVLSLLAYEADAEPVLLGAVARDADDWIQQQEVSEVGTYVGPYLLVRELHGGGMGSVHLGVRSDDQYFQIVAIKMIRKGLATRRLVQRFRAERQILASLTHPNIGTILDGGITPDGRPFMVMEYVEGQPITEGAKARCLNLRQRLELFEKVCAATHYAHQRMIVHRDIKPSNVLVTPEGIVKLIDFGIAQAPFPEFFANGEAEGAHTPLTPDYASPEQLQGEEVTASTDLYSLGVLLYELLTDTQPYTLHGLSMRQAQKLVSKGVQTLPSALPHLDRRARKALSGDLDAIVQRLLQVDPAQRYPSVRHLQEDLERYLANRPLAADQTNLFVHVRKLVQRQRPLVLTVLFSSILLLCGFFVSVVEGRRSDARVAEMRKLANAAVLQLADDLQKGPTTTQSQAAVFHRAVDSLNTLDTHSVIRDPRVALELSKAYIRVGELEGSPSVPNLGNLDAAISSYESALRTAQAANASEHNGAGTAAIITAYLHLADLYAFSGDVRKADTEYQHTLSFAEPFWKSDPRNPARVRLLTLAYMGRGENALYKLEPDEAALDYSRAAAVLVTVPNGQLDHDLHLADLGLAMSRAWNELGNQNRALGEIEESLRVDEVLDRSEPDSPLVQRERMVAYGDMVLVLAGREMLNVGDAARAELYATRMLALAQGAVNKDSTNAQAAFDLTTALTRMGDAYRESSPRKAAEWYRKAIVVTRKWLPRYGSEAKHRLAIQDESLAEVLSASSQTSERLRSLEEANRLRGELAGNNLHARLHLMRSYCLLSDAELAANDLPSALTHAEAASAMFADFDSSSQSLLVTRDLGLCLVSEGDLHRRIALDPKRSSGERVAAKAAAHEFYLRAARVWAEWSRRGASTPESLSVQARIQKLLGLSA